MIAAIPARMASSRFPGKPLALLAGEPMILHVLRRAWEARLVDEVLVATDSPEIAEVVEAAGGRAVMTGECASGTDRIARALLARGEAALVLNIQGDEPLLPAVNVDTLVRGMLERPDVELGTLCRPLDARGAADANAVKVVRRHDGRALYFSRSMIPYPRNPEALEMFRLHLGIYAYRPEALKRLVALPPSPLEAAEGLEQLRALENGMDMLVLDAPEDSWGVDTPEDLLRAEAILAGRQNGETGV